MLLSVFLKTAFAKEFVSSMRQKDTVIEIDTSTGSLPSLAISATLSQLYKKKNGNGSLIVCGDDETAHQLIADLTALLPDEVFLFFPGAEILDGVVLPLAKRSNSYQMKALHYLVSWKAGLVKTSESKNTERGCNGSSLEILKAPIVVTTPEGLLTDVVAPHILYEQILTLSNGELSESDEIALKLVELGYSSCSAVVSAGQFSVRGGVIDIFSPHDRFPVRLELWGDEIDSMRRFDPFTQRSVEELESASFMPFVQNKSNGQSNYTNEQKIQDIQQKSPNEQQNAHIGDYLNGSSLFFWNLSPLERKNSGTALAKAFGPNCLELEIASLYKRMKSAFLQGAQIKHSSFVTVRAGAKTVPRFGADLNSFMSWLKQHRESKNFVAMAMSSNGELDRLSELLENYSVSYHKEQKRLDSRVAGVYKVSINAGFEIDDFCLLGTSDLWDERTIVNDDAFILPEEQRVSFTDFTELSPGCLIVHVENGVGKFTQLNSLLIDGVRQEFLEIEYAKGDKLFVPVSQLDRVQKFVGNEGGRKPKLNRLGGTRWGQVRSRVKKSVEKLARELLSLYAKREAAEGYALPPDTVWQSEMEDAFPFNETRDQLSALKNIKKLQEKPSPMDLLLCGDVGYGKTELAIRAAFKTVQEGRQVAILVPTTILAHQHFLTFTGRLAPFPVSIAVMSRLKGTASNRATAKMCGKGEVDMVIGTHRLLSKDVRFKKLGLLVIDEEQRFGVKAKEKIKELKTSVDVLSLSATPIPRTLNLALSGARDISVINTPPKGRLPVRTVVEEYSDSLVSGAIKRELSRGGQVYYVNNRIQEQDLVLMTLKKLLPDARIRAGHGRMKASDLETLMMDFYNRKFDVLISTTIIESGLDIPNVNTMIIEDSHRLGLSQLYQLRGRVGRMTRQAYAFLLYPPRLVLPEIAFKRLKAIEDFSELGSGFKVAMRDLELRGAGSILGSNQHGFVQSVGFELYTRLLRDAVADLKAEQENKRRPSEPTVIELQADMFISEDYITCPELKMLFYRKLAEVQSFTALEEVVAEMKDRFGAYPERLESLVRSVRCKIKANELGIKLIKQGINEIAFTLFKGASLAEEFAGRLVAMYQGRISFKKEFVDKKEVFDADGAFSEKDVVEGFVIRLNYERNSQLLDLVEKVLW